jgi:hypothetical protein
MTTATFQESIFERVTSVSLLVIGVLLGLAQLAILLQ